MKNCVIPPSTMTAPTAKLTRRLQGEGARALVLAGSGHSCFHLVWAGAGRQEESRSSLVWGFHGDPMRRACACLCDVGARGEEAGGSLGIAELS